MLKEVESHRRSKWVLNNLDALDLSDQPEVLAAKATTQARNQRPVKALLKEFESQLAPRMGKQQAAEAVAAPGGTRLGPRPGMLREELQGYGSNI